VTKIPITVTVIHHKPFIGPPPDEVDRYPINPRFPPDPAIYAPVIAYDCRLLDEGMGR
jgi:hypothetical protein